MSRGRGRLTLWLSAMAIAGFLLSYEADHSRDTFWWCGTVGANLLLVASAAPSIMRGGKTFPLRALVVLQLIIAIEASIVRWTGTIAVLGAGVISGLCVSVLNNGQTQ